MRWGELLKSVEREAWVRFFIALFGLTFAFAAALFSTAARESGNLLATAVLASSALVLAAAVGIATVPYLARRVALRRVRDAFNYDVTREGVFYLALTLLIAIAALNTGNNLLFLVVSAMLGAVVVSGVASARVLTGLELDLELPAHMFARQSYAAVLSLRNRRRFTSALSVSVVPPVRKKAGSRWAWRRTVFVFPKSEEGKRAWIRWPDVTLVRVPVEAPKPGILDRPVYFPFVPARQAAKSEVELRFESRGRYEQRGLGLATRFPFSFLVKTRTVPIAREVVVYPSVSTTEELTSVLPLITGEFESHVRGRGYDLYRIRDYAPEDPVRHIDWKSTAKSGALKVREFTREDERRLRIVFDNPAPGQLTPERYELGIQLAASLAWHFAAENTELTFAAPGYIAGDGVYGFLGYLADAQPGSGQSVLESLPLTGDYNVVLTARERGTIPTSVWQSSYILFLNE
ncbi:MAG TPA: DUF58 domain-containing protein [Clostridia bacterium]|nr:DUF58 domain-containing protein [Clostridia bacterium]